MGISAFPTGGCGNFHISHSLPPVGNILKANSHNPKNAFCRPVSHYSFKHELVAIFWVDAFSLGDSGLIPSFEIFLLFEFNSGFWSFVVPHSWFCFAFLAASSLLIFSETLDKPKHLHIISNVHIIFYSLSSLWQSLTSSGSSFSPLPIQSTYNPSIKLFSFPKQHFQLSLMFYLRLCFDLGSFVHGLKGWIERTAMSWYFVKERSSGWIHGLSYF